MKDQNKTSEVNLLQPGDVPPKGHDRREFLKCMGAWAGTGLVLTMAGGIL